MKSIKITPFTSRTPALLSELLFRLDPANTACKENEAYDEYDNFAVSVCDRAADLAGVFTEQDWNQLSTIYFGVAIPFVFLQRDEDVNIEVVFPFMESLTGDYEELLAQGLTLIEDEAGAVWVTLEQFQWDMDSGAFTSDETGHWACVINGKRYRKREPLNPYEGEPSWASHVYWYGK